LDIEFIWWTYWLLALLVFFELGKKAFFSYFGAEKIVPKKEEMTKFAVVERTPEKLVIGATMPVKNIGEQCGVIMDAILRVQLPYEQYDGALVRGKVELEGAPREDNYFEAMVIQKGEQINLVLKLSIEGRKGNTLEEAIAHMVDFRMDLIYQEAGRIPAHYSKQILKITGSEIAALAGVALVQEGGRKNG
jgi:hypothetical protein